MMSLHGCIPTLIINDLPILFLFILLLPRRIVLTDTDSDILKLVNPVSEKRAARGRYIFACDGGEQRAGGTQRGAIP